MNAPRDLRTERAQLVRLSARMLAIATAILVTLALAHAWLAHLAPAQAVVNLVVGLVTAWMLTFLIFNVVFRLADQITARDRQLAVREREIQALQRVSRTMGDTLDVRSIAEVMLQEARGVTDSSWGYIALRDPEAQILQIVASEGGKAQPASLLAAEAALIGEAMVRDAPLLLSDAPSTLATPITYEGVAAGVLVLHGAAAGRYDAQSAGFALALAKQASIAIGSERRFREQRRLNEALRRRTEQQQSLFEATVSMRMDKPLETILEDIAYAIQESVGFNIVLISAVDGDPPHLRRMAGAGIPLDTLEQLKRRPQAMGPALALFQDRFLLSQSYFVPHQEKAVWESQLDALTLIPAREDPTIETWHPEDILFTPLRGSDGRLLGVVSVDDPVGGKVPDQAAVEVLETFAVLASLAIENAALYGTAQRRVNELDALNRIGQALSSSLETRDLLEGIYHHASRIIPASWFTIALADREGGGFAFPLVYALGELAAPQHTALIQRVADLRAPLLISPDRADPAEPVEGSWMGAPMLAAGKVIGVIALQNLDPLQPYDAPSLNLLATIATQAAAALQNARLYEQIRHFNAALEERVRARTDELAQANVQIVAEKERVETLYRITRELNASLDLDRILARALTLVSQAVSASHGAILLLDRQTGKLGYRTMIGRARPLGEDGQPLEADAERGVLAWVMQHRETLILADAPQDPIWREAPLELLGKARSLLAAPLMMGDDVLGLLLLSDPRPGLLTQEHLRLVSAAAVQVAQAISNAELYRLILEQARRLGETLRTQQTEASEKAAILDGIADGVLMVDPQGTIILMNHAAEEILDAQTSRLIGRSVHSAGDQGAPDRTAAGLAVLKEWLPRGWDARPGQEMEARYQVERRTIKVRLAAVQMAGEVLGAVAVFRDMTREVEADRAKTEFISTVSHELRTPLTAIKGYTDLLGMGAVGSLNDSQRRFLEIIKSNVGRLGNLVAELLDISRIESGRMALEVEPVALPEVLEQALASMRGNFATRRVLLSAQVDPDLPPVLADRRRILQVLTNLLQNACQYTPPGGQATLSARCVDGHVRVDIRDTGIGISEEDQSHIFERFFRADHPVVLETQGTGLGLVITKSIVEMHHGQLWLQSKLGEGSTFSFTLPLSAEGHSTVPSASGE